MNRRIRVMADLAFVGLQTVPRHGRVDSTQKIQGQGADQQEGRPEQDALIAEGRREAHVCTPQVLLGTAWYARARRQTSSRN